jgi:hypothetical protein
MPLPFSVFTPSGELVAECKTAEDAAAMLQLYGQGATIRVAPDGGRLVTIFTEGRDAWALDDYNVVREVILMRAKAVGMHAVQEACAVRARHTDRIRGQLPEPL